MKKIYFLILTLITFAGLNAQVTVTPPSLIVSGCTFPAVPTPYTSLGNITITETAINDISGTGTFILTAPVNFQFQAPGSVTATPTGGDLTIGAVTIGGGGTTLTFTIKVNSTVNIDVITISGLMVRGLLHLQALPIF